MTRLKLALVCTLALAALGSVQSANAKIVDFSYYPPGDQTYQEAPSNVSAAAVRNDAIALTHRVWQPRREFGFASHYLRPSVADPAVVAAGARQAARDDHQPFTL